MSDKIKSIKISGVERNIEDITTREMLEQEIERANNDSTQIKGRVSTVEARSIDSQTKLNTLQGSGEGSIRKSIQDAIDALPNTYYNKGEVVDLVDEHKPYIWSGNTSTAIFNEIKKAAEYGSNIILNYKNLSVTSVSDSTITGFIDNGTTLTNYTITKDNVSTTITNIDPTSKQDVIPDLSDIRQGATLGKTALQEIPEDYKKAFVFTEDILNNPLTDDTVTKIREALNNNTPLYYCDFMFSIPLSVDLYANSKGPTFTGILTLTYSEDISHGNNVGLYLISFVVDYSNKVITVKYNGDAFQYFLDDRYMPYWYRGVISEEIFNNIKTAANYGCNIMDGYQKINITKVENNTIYGFVDNGTSITNYTITKDKVSKTTTDYKGTVTKVQINGYDKTPDANGVVNLGYGILDKVKMNGTEYTGGSTSEVDLGTVIKEVKYNGTALTASSGSVNIPAASTSAYGVTKLSDATNSDSSVLAATPKAVKAAYDLANGKLDKSTADNTYLKKADKAASATTADSATKATQDGNGNVITSTYLPLTGTASSSMELKPSSNNSDVVFTRDHTSTLKYDYTITNTHESLKDIATGYNNAIITIPRHTNGELYNSYLLFTGGGMYLSSRNNSNSWNWQKIMKETDTATTSKAGLISAADKTKLDGIATGAEVNVQSDWSVTDTTSDAYIKNKPTIPSAVTESTVSGWGFTKNAGTVTKVQINGYDKSPNNSGIVDLGMGILDKVKMNGTEYSGGSTSTVDLGTVITELKLNSAALAPTSGSISIPNASTSTYGATKLSSATNSTSTSLAATPKAVKDAYDLANGKQDKLTSGTNIKTINNTSLLGSGNISITHPDDGAGAAGSYAATNPTSLVGATKITIPTVTVNTRGHVSAAGINEVSVPDFTKYATSITCDDMVAGVVGNTVDITTFFSGLQTRLVSGTNIKTINGKSILGKGNIDTGIEYLTLLASSFGNSDGSASIYPGKYYKVIEDVNDIRFKLEPPTSSNILNEYLVEFKCVGSVTLPDTLLWPESGVPEFVPGNTYQLSIVNDLAVCVCFVDDLNIGTLSFNGSIWNLVFEKPVASALDIRWSYEDMYNPGNYIYDEFFGSISSGSTTASGGIGANRPISVTITPSSDSTWRYGVNIISNHSEEV